MYRIHFDPTVSKFVVQMLIWGLFWETCMKVHDDQDGPHTVKLPRQFHTYADACKWVSDIGLADAYEVQQPKRTLYSTAHAR
jgi:hypothetical protein